MFQIKITVVGKTLASWWQSAEGEYLKRLSHYAKIKQVFVKEEKIAEHKTLPQIQAIEAQRIEDSLDSNEYRVALVKEGHQLSSKEFARWLEKLANQGISRINFIIGGPLGLPESFVKQCDYQLSLSIMTFTHEMSRVILLEQLYRGFSILKNENYHK
ncbi:23S rRNA (pseudouridine(1915)-N(3))-methyltransferase RlmH [candidate division KSB1 bacterium]|nr:23S rRNA (pseudouridine(1915)-N(3))-methyltransferase RlmH [candidate division KSB1 bacterium]